MKMLKILYYLVKNHFKNGEDMYSAVVQSRGSIDQAGLIRSMIYRGSSINESDILAVLRDYFDAIYEALLNGNSVTTPLLNLQSRRRRSCCPRYHSIRPTCSHSYAVYLPGGTARSDIRSSSARPGLMTRIFGPCTTPTSRQAV
jgi:hypothetical protein